MVPPIVRSVQYSFETSICFKSLSSVGHCIYFAIHSSHHIPTFAASRSLSSSLRPFSQLAPWFLTTAVASSAEDLLVGRPTSGDQWKFPWRFHANSYDLELQWINMQPSAGLSHKEHTHKNKRMCVLPKASVLFAGFLNVLNITANLRFPSNALLWECTPDTCSITFFIF